MPNLKVPSTHKKKNVLMLLSNAFDPDPRVHNEAKALVKNGYEVTILCWDRDYKKPEHEVIDGINIERIFIRSTHGRGITQVFYLFLFWLKTYLRIKKNDFQIIHCHDFDTLPIGYIISMKISGSKLVYDSHESYIDMLLNIPLWFKWLIYRFENFFLKRVDLLITVGEKLKQALGDRGAQVACVVGNWKDVNEFDFQDAVLAEEKEKIGVLKNQVVVSFIANLTTERKLPQLIEAVQNEPDFFLLLGGNGSCKEMAEEASKNCNNIYYLGFVDPSKIPFYTVMSDVVFYGFDPEIPNSKYSAPNKLFEALAAGKPIISADFGEIGRIIKKESCGVIIGNYSATDIRAAIRNIKSDLIGFYKTNALAAARELYNWPAAEQILLEHYRPLAE